MININKKNSADVSENHALLVLPKSKVEKINWLNEKENNYIIEKRDKGDTFITINHFDQFVIVVLIDTEKVHHLQLEDCRKNGHKALSLLSDHKNPSLDIVLSQLSKDHAIAIVEGIGLSSYRFIKYFKNQDDKTVKLKNISIFCDELTEKEIHQLSTLLQATFYVRDLINEPVNVLNAEALSEEILHMGTEAGIEVEIFNKQRIEALKMGGLLAVNKGSVDPPTFTVMEWKPKNAVNEKPYILIGKGVVYDTGGLSLKPTGDSMDYMKSDMSGAATVAGVMYSIAKNKLPLYIVALIPATDNRPSGNAYTPGDVIHMMDGTTVEVLNSDAEGRMILADALTYSKRYDPILTITVATLTGSASVAIGNYALVAMGNATRETMQKLIESADFTGERIAEFPFWDDYAQELKSDIADLKNIGSKSAGAITAGKFLEHFAPKPLIHFDIAGVAFSKKNDNYRGKGGTAFGLRLLYHFFENQILPK